MFLSPQRWHNWCCGVFTLEKLPSLPVRDEVSVAGLQGHGLQSQAIAVIASPEGMIRPPNKNLGNRIPRGARCEVSMLAHLKDIRTFYFQWLMDPRSPRHHAFLPKRGRGKHPQRKNPPWERLRPGESFSVLPGRKCRKRTAFCRRSR